MIETNYNIYIISFDENAKRLRDRSFRDVNYPLPENPFNKANTVPVFQVDEKTSEITILFNDETGQNKFRNYVTTVSTDKRGNISYQVQD